MNKASAPFKPPLDVHPGLAAVGRAPHAGRPRRDADFTGGQHLEVGDGHAGVAEREPLRHGRRGQLRADLRPIRRVGGGGRARRRTGIEPAACCVTVSVEFPDRDDGAPTLCGRIRRHVVTEHLRPVPAPGEIVSQAALLVAVQPQVAFVVESATLPLPPDAAITCDVEPSVSPHSPVDCRRRQPGSHSARRRRQRPRRSEETPWCSPRPRS